MDISIFHKILKIFFFIYIISYRFFSTAIAIKWVSCDDKGNISGGGGGATGVKISTCHMVYKVHHFSYFQCYYSLNEM